MSSLTRGRGLAVARLLKGRGAAWLAVAAWAALIFAVSSQTSFPTLTQVPRLQEVAGHAAVYAVLALLCLNGLRQHRLARPWAWAFLACLLYALSDEFHQSFVPGRSAEVFDLVVDTLAAACALAVAWNWTGVRGALARAKVISRERRRP